MPRLLTLVGERGVAVPGGECTRGRMYPAVDVPAEEDALSPPPSATTL